MIEVHDLCKTYDDLPALSGVSFSIEAGEVIGLLGPNGAGKTTLMKILTGYLHPTAGTATVGGHDVLEATEEVQKLIGYLPENAPLYPELSVQASLQMMADLRGIPQDLQRHSIAEAVYAVGLEDRLARPVGTLSKGYRQRVGLAQAILHKPKLLILDEPTNGLDPTQIIEVRHLIRKLAEKATVLISTHILSEVEATCDRAIIIIRGQLKADAKLADLATASDAYVSFSNQIDKEQARKELMSLAGVKEVLQLDRRAPEVQFLVKGTVDHALCPAIYELAKSRDWPLVELKKEMRTLEAVFRELAAADGGVV